MTASEENFHNATERYFRVLRTQVTLVDSEIKKRHKKIADSTPFEFLRATFYRWAQWWPEVCEDLNHEDVPLVLGVGDLHAENFGTWRDTEGRLVWGVNDFDECCCLPYTNDLVRLAASTRFAIEEPETKKLLKEAKEKEWSRKEVAERLRQITQDRAGRFREACHAIINGYHDTLDPEHTNVVRKPFVLAEKKVHTWLREIVLNKLPMQDEESDFDAFLQELTELSNVNSMVPSSAWEALHQSMPEPGVLFRIGKRDAGLGSLGRQRFTAVVDDWCGGIVAREAKALAPSAWWWWDETKQNTTEILYSQALRQAVRARDPWIRIVLGAAGHSWVVRRLAPDSGKVKLQDLPKGRQLEDDLWRAMGHETANVHVGLGNVWEDLKKRQNKEPDWLYHSATSMADKMVQDWETR